MFEMVLKFGAYIVDQLCKYLNPVIVYIPPYGELRGGAWAVVDPTINPVCMQMFVDPRSRGGVLEPEGIVQVKMRKVSVQYCVFFNTRSSEDLDHRNISFNEIENFYCTADMYRSLFVLDITSAKFQSGTCIIFLINSFWYCFINGNYLEDLVPLMRRLDKEMIRLGVLEKEGKDVKMDINARIQLLMPTYRNIAITFADLHDTPVRMKAVGAIKVFFLFQIKF